MGVFFIPAGLQQTAAFLSEAEAPPVRPLLDLTLDNEIRYGAACRPYRIVKLEEQIASVLDGADASALADELALLGERLSGAIEQYRNQPDQPAFLAGYEQAATAVNRMAVWFDTGEESELRGGFNDLEAAERAIQEMIGPTS